MAEIRNQFSNSQDYSSLFSSMTNNTTGLDLTDYAAIRNGSYKKLVKAYYSKQESGTTDSKKTEETDSKQKRTLLKSGAEALQNSMETLMDPSLWEKKTIRKKDETTKEETTVQDYDREAIAKAVTAFVKNYNDVIGKAADSNDRNVLRNAARMTGTSQEMSKLLKEVGISIGTENKLEVDEEKLGNASIGTLKTLFTGMHSFADKISQKASAIGRATSGTNNTYTNNATYSNTLSKLVAGKIDQEI